ncbi:MAG: S8 family peptidase [Oscillospiraceae bacterium]|nr:S8 family peptidase [Oscillospiraceae bacterium]
MNGYEDIVYDPDIEVLILESEAMPTAFLENNPYIKYKTTVTGGYTILYVHRDDIEQIISNTVGYSSNVFPLVLGLLGSADLESSGILQVHRQPFLNLMGSGVLLGIVSTGIDYTQAAFRYEDGSSKIQYIWDQTIRGGAPEGFYYGTQYDNQTINSALLLENPRQAVPHVDSVGHGTFLASVAASRESGQYIGAAPDSELIVVKLKRARPTEYRRYLIPVSQQNAFSSADIIMGVEYIISKAAQLGRPVAICIPLGTNIGAHDGGSTLEGYLSRVASIVGTAVCVAAGNEAQAGHHTNIKLSGTGDTKNIEIRVGDGFEDVNIAMWNFAADRMSVAVTSPAGEHVTRVPARSGTTYTQRLILERSTVLVEYQFPAGKYSVQYTKIHILSATPGIWKITVYGDSVLDGGFHMWLPMTGFINPETVFLAPKPNYTTTIPATSTGVIACGAYNSLDGSLSPTSSWGPSRLQLIRPDLVAPGVDVGGIFPGGPGKMSGTSVSAAITAGACALMLQWGIVEGNDPSLESYRIRADLITGCSRDPGREYPNNQWGYGRLNLYNTFQMLRPH